MSKAIPTEAMIEAAAKVLNERLAKEDGLFGVSRDMLSAALSSVPPAVPEEVETAHPTDNQVVAAVKAYISIEGKCRPAAMRSALSAALSASPAQPVAIKPLEWDECTQERTHADPEREVVGYENASPIGIFYGIRIEYDGFHASSQDDHLGAFDTLDAAKAAAQSDYESRIRSALVPPAVPVEVEPHSDDLAVDRFAAAMKAKLAEKRAQGYHGWDDPEDCTIEHLSNLLVKHVGKGDPVDVGNFAMMIHQRGGRIE